MSGPFASSHDSPAASAARLLARLGMAVLALGLPVAALGSRRAIFILFPIGAALILAGGLLRGGEAGFRRFGAALSSPAGLMALLLAAWSAASILWTPYPADAQEHLLKTIGTALLCAVAVAALPERARIADVYFLPVGVALAAIGLIALTLRGGLSLDQNALLAERGIITAIMLLWPAVGALGLRKRWTPSIGLCIFVAAAAIVGWSPAGLVALAVGALAFAAARADLAAATRAFAIVAVAAFLAAPALAQLAPLVKAPAGGALQALVEPLSAWAAIVKADPARLVTGHGLDAASRGLVAGVLPQGAPRSLLFEIWFDFGVVGAAAAAALAAFAFLGAARTGRTAGSAAAATLATGLTLACIGPNTTQIWWLTLVGVAAIGCAAVHRAQYQTNRPKARLQSAAGRAFGQSAGSEPT